MHRTGLGPGEIDQRVLCFQHQNISNEPTKTFIFCDGRTIFSCTLNSYLNIFNCAKNIMKSCMDILQ